jgi:hypothetical protein
LVVVLARLLFFLVCYSSRRTSVRTEKIIMSSRVVELMLFVDGAGAKIILLDVCSY